MSQRSAGTRMFWHWLCLTAVVGACCLPVSLPAAEPMDVIFKRGRVVDGSGAPWYVADVGIRKGHIVAIGRLDGQAARRTIDATGLIVAPGFTDMMGQSASSLLENPQAAVNLLSQGITTINCGEGVSAAPQSDSAAKATGWQGMAEYFQLLDMKGLPVNVTQTVGHTQVRLMVLGDVDRRPLGDELDRMKAHVREAMEAGAIGLSTSLIYPPAVYASTEEIAELAKVAGEYGGRYYTHMRNEGDRLLEAIDEALSIGRTAHTPVHIFHLKAAGRENWDKMAQAIAAIKGARAEGQQVTADIYPYINNGLGIAALVHPRHFTEGEAKLRSRLGEPELRLQIRREMETEGGWENWFRHVGGDWNKVIVGTVADERYAPLSGQSLAAIAKARGEDPWDTFFNLVSAGAFALPESMAESNVTMAMQQEFISFCTDVGPAGGSRIAAHPRAFGAFPRMLARYVREQGALSLERAVAQASAVAANEVFAYDRGRIAIGLAADVIAFQYDQVVDRATFAELHQLAEGMKYVVVNGELVWDGGKQTKRRPGKVLRGPGYIGESLPARPDSKTGAVSPDQAPAARAAQTGQFAPIDRLFTQFLEHHRVPGCAVAVTDQGRLVYARGFGQADIAERRPVTPTSLFRIASISKPITAVAILQLVEQGKLSLDDRVFDILKVEPHLENGAAVDERQKEITIRQLLQHRGGWDRDRSFDAMFQSVRFAKALGTPSPAGPHDVIRCMLGQRLDFSPGERFAYSNYGYCLLGRVIETLTQQPYEQYVKEHTLAPAGIRSMRLGRTRLEERQADEVRYYDPASGSSVFAADQGSPVSHPYGAWNLEAMDAHGGWLASSVDLARFACAFDNPAKSALLQPSSIEAMFARPAAINGKPVKNQPNGSYYALGWFVRPAGPEGKFNSWHTGSLPGTATILIRRHDGRNIAILFNSRVSPYVDHLTKSMDPLIHKALDEVREWPTCDLFDQYQ